MPEGCNCSCYCSFFPLSFSFFIFLYISTLHWFIRSTNLRFTLLPKHFFSSLSLSWLFVCLMHPLYFSLSLSLSLCSHFFPSPFSSPLTSFALFLFHIWLQYSTSTSALLILPFTIWFNFTDLGKLFHFHFLLCFSLFYFISPVHNCQLHHDSPIDH